MQDDFAVRQDLQREMEPGERLLWAGRPDPIRMMVPSLSLFFFGIPWTAFIVVSFVQGPDSGDLIFGLFKIPFVLAGVWMLSSPIWAYLKARRTLYGITDRQVLIVTAGSTRTVQSFREGDIMKIARTERADGGGNLTFSERQTRDSEGHTSTEDVALIGIPEVREVEKILRTAFRKD